MADISNYLNAIMSARYGEDVRSSIYNAIQVMNKQAEKVEVFAGDINSLRSEDTAIKTKLNTLTSRTDSQGTQISDLRSNVNTLTSRTDSQEGRIASAEVAISGLRTNTNDNTTKINSVEDHISGTALPDGADLNEYYANPKAGIYVYTGKGRLTNAPDGVENKMSGILIVSAPSSAQWTYQIFISENPTNVYFRKVNNVSINDDREVTDWSCHNDPKPTTEKNFNNLLESGTYVIDGMTIMTNGPKKEGTYPKGLLIVSTFDDITGDPTTFQVFISMAARLSDPMNVYSRNIIKSGSSTMTSTWISPTEFKATYIKEGDDLDTYVEPGIYWYAGTTVSNLPIDTGHGKSGILMVTIYENMAYQIFISENPTKVYFREVSRSDNTVIKPWTHNNDFDAKSSLEDDFNKYLTSGVYYIDESKKMTHAPEEKSYLEGLLLISSIDDKKTCQIFITTTPGKGNVYARSIITSQPDTTITTKWSLINDLDATLIREGDNLNTYVESGVYVYTGIGRCANIPIGVQDNTSGILMVSVYDDIAYQMFISENPTNVYFREVRVSDRTIIKNWTYNNVAETIRNDTDLDNLNYDHIYFKEGSTKNIDNYPKDIPNNWQSFIICLNSISYIKVYPIQIVIGISGDASIICIRKSLSFVDGKNNWSKWFTLSTTSINFVDSHRNTYRGINLGSEVTEAQKEAIRNGTFEGLYVGDYWNIDGVNWRVADMDYWYNTGDTAFTNHHLVIVPDRSLYNAAMNDENTTDGGYVGSKMYTENLEQAKQKIKAAFGDVLLSHKEYLINAVTDGHSSGGAWFDSEVELMNEIMVYGCHIRAAMNTGSPVAYTYTVEKQQLALFQLDPKMINRRITYWLRDVVSATNFAYVNNDGNANNYSASNFFGVRPVFAIG